MTQGQTIHTIAAKLTDDGQARDHNEDYVAILIPQEQLQLQQKGALYIVADGMGGHQAGEVASQRAVEVIQQFYYTTPPHLNAEEQPDLAATLRHAVEKANADVHALSEQSLARKGMGTTVVAAVVRDNEVHIANVGDSRAYLLRNGKLDQITTDHSFVQEQVDAGILTEEAARVHPQRNVITRALGHKPQIKVDTFGGVLAPGDIILLCSDGLSGPVQNKDIEEILQQYPPDQAVIQLISKANAQGGPDNISAVIIKAQAPVAGQFPARELPPASLQPAKVEKQQTNTPPKIPVTPIKAGNGIPQWAMYAAGGIILMLVLGILFTKILGGSSQASPTPPVEGTVTQEAGNPLTTSTATSETPGVGPTSTAAPIPSTPTPEPVQELPPGQQTEQPEPTGDCVPQLPRPVEPAGESTHIAWTNVTFRWEGGQRCKENQVWQITFNGQAEICPPTTDHYVTCQLTLDPGEYIWRIEIWEDGVPIDMDQAGRTIFINSPTDNGGTDSGGSSGGDTGGDTGGDPGDKE